ncbi:MAG: alpha/beta hydrolase [Dehalococcoidia bacterium]|nr:alpha/beta hydrolase [Dehalococcoidia bacterium]
MADAVEQQLASRPEGEEPSELRVDSDGLVLSVFEWAGEGRPVVLTHATGFHARTWDTVARLLPGQRVIAIDLRGHGRSDNPEPPIGWDHFGADVAAVVRSLDLQRAVGVGHSMGGHSTTVAAAREPGRFASLLLLDPVMRGGPASADPEAARPSGAFEFIAKRRNEWASPEEMVERFRDRFPYNVWAPGVLEDYARGGLLPNPDGDGFVLACPPAIEASIYGSAGSGSADLETEVIPQVRVPVRVVRARQRQPGEEAPPFATSPTRPDLASLFADGHDVLRPEMSHFIPMQDPAFVARHILDLAASADAAGLNR